MLRGATQRGGRGQAIVEFAFAAPIFFVLLLGVVEVAMLLQAEVTTNFATRQATLIAAEAGDASGADCSILQAVEQSIAGPADKAAIVEVKIFDADLNGNELSPPAENVYHRTGSMSCILPNGTTGTVPYSIFGTSSYPSADRCNILAGCPGPPAQTTVDTIGVQITYTYHWHTPLAELLGGPDAGRTIVKSNAMRMEPVL